MEAAPRKRARVNPRIATATILVVGVVVSVVAFIEQRRIERDRAEAEFVRRATIRHTLTREVVGRYEDALFGLAALFNIDKSVSRMEFARAAQRLAERNPSAQAFEWVPVVPAASRAEVEADMAHTHRRNFEFVERDAGGRLQRAGDRPTYYPICYIEPFAGNEMALGYDLQRGPTVKTLEQARETRRMSLSPQVRLVQGEESDLGLVMVWPVYRALRLGAPAAEDVFLGFVQGVFKTRSLLERTRTDHPDTILDMLFVDATETDPARRVLYFRPSEEATSREPMPTEAEFRTQPHHELSMPIGGREWRVIYRPRAGWMDQQMTPLPYVRSLGLIAITGLIAGLVHVLGRRTESVEREVRARTTELADSRHELDTLLRALPGMAYRCRYDDRLTILYVSEGALALTGHRPDAFIAGRVHFRDLIHPDDVERVRSATRSALEEKRDIEVSYRLRHVSGAEKWVLSRGRAVYNADGKPQVFEGLAIDVTAQKDAETARLGLERKMLEGQKLESLGVLAGGVAHDFNNLLTSILGNAGLVRLSATGEAVERAKEIEQAARRAAELSRQMLAYAGKGRFVVEPINITTLSESMLPLVKSSLGRTIALHVDFSREVPAVMADATQLRQILMNLVINAADAIGDSVGRIDVSTGVMQASAGWLARAVVGDKLTPGEYVFLEVRDTGCGMSSEVMAKIFDPFFTTKSAGRGLGLAAVLGIVRGHHGALRVDSTTGVGTNFRLLLPPSLDTVVTPAPPTVAVPRAKPVGRVLVIDDDSDVCAAISEMLAALGYSSETTADLPAGLAAFRASPDSFAAVILDLQLPEPGGEPALRALRALRSNIRVLLTSSFHEPETVSRLAGGGPLGFVQKPFTDDELGAKLHELLG